MTLKREVQPKVGQNLNTVCINSGLNCLFISPNSSLRSFFDLFGSTLGFKLIQENSGKSYKLTTIFNKLDLSKDQQEKLIQKTSSAWLKIPCKSLLLKALTASSIHNDLKNGLSRKQLVDKYGYSYRQISRVMNYSRYEMNEECK